MSHTRQYTPNSYSSWSVKVENIWSYIGSNFVVSDRQNQEQQDSEYLPDIFKLDHLTLFARVWILGVTYQHLN